MASRRLASSVRQLAETTPGPKSGPVIAEVEAVRRILTDVSAAREAAEAKLVESERRYRDLYENAPDMYASVDARTGTVVQCNQTMVRVTGFSKEEIIGRPVLDLYHPESVETAEKALQSFRTTGEAHNAELQLVRKDGSKTYVILNASAVYDESGAILYSRSSLRDITDRIKAEKALRESEQRYRAVVENLHVGISVLNPAMEIVAINRFFQKIFPKIEPGRGQYCYQMYHDPPRSLPCDPCPCLMTFHDGMVHEYVTETSVGNSVRNFRVVSCPIKDAEGQVELVVELAEDITETRSLQLQLSQAQKMEAIGTLAGGVAHDFNNLLQVALGYSELLLGDEDMPRQYQSDLQKIHESARRGADLVGRLLTFSRKTEIKPQPLNLNHRITELRKMLTRALPKMIDLQLSLGEPLATIGADPTQIDQVLMNLAVNARDAMPEGGRLLFETANVFLDEDYARTHLGTTTGNYVLLTVTDNGFGMDRATSEHIFEPFYTTKGVGEGTGLGLAMVHGIVKQHGGYINCYSEPGEGTSFKIYFPAVASHEEPAEPRAVRMPPGGTETVLLVDDEDFIRDFGSRILAKAGYKVLAASNGKHALELYEARSTEIALVILDLIMPEMGGRQCLQALLSLNPAVKVVIASGYSADGPTKDALSAGAKAYVSKPYDIRQMRQVVRDVLEKEPVR
jgi:two-component system, cell cycle sensor histidine kinase and response regulator CckA